MNDSGTQERGASRPLGSQYTEAIDRGLRAGIPQRDIQYLLDLPSRGAISRRARKISAGSGEEFELPGKASAPEKLSLRKAAAVYQAQFDGWGDDCLDEVLRVAEAPLSEDRTVGYLIDNEGDVGPIVIRAIRVLYDAPGHNVPYVTPELEMSLHGVTLAEKLSNALSKTE